MLQRTKATTVTMREEGVGSQCPCTSHGRKVCRALQRKAGSGRPSLCTDCSSPSVGAGELGWELVSDAKESPCFRGNGTGCSRSIPCSGDAGSHVPAAVTGNSNEVRANAVRGCDHNVSCVPDLGYHLSPPFHQWERLVSGALAHVGASGQAPGPDSQLVWGKPSRAPAFLGRQQHCHVGLYTFSRRFPPPTNS